MPGELPALEYRRRLTQAILRVRQIQNRNHRDLYISELELQLGYSVATHRYTDALHDVRALVGSCMSDPGAMRAFVQVIRSFHGDSAVVVELGQLLDEIESDDQSLSPRHRQPLTELVQRVDGNRAAAAFQKVFRTVDRERQPDLSDHGVLLGEIAAVADGPGVRLLAFADELAHREEGRHGLELHRWVREVGRDLGLSLHDLRQLCVQTTRTLGQLDEPFAESVAQPGVSEQAEVTETDTVVRVSQTGDFVQSGSVVKSVEVLDRSDTGSIWGGVPLRNPEFTGREALLQDLEAQLLRQGTASVLPQALHGWGGVGKTQLAVEFAYRHAEEYDIVWWITADQPDLVRASLALLGDRLQLPEGQDMQHRVTTVLD